MEHDLTALGRPVQAIGKELVERDESIGEELGLLWGFQRELELTGVLDPTMHGSVRSGSSPDPADRGPVLRAACWIPAAACRFPRGKFAPLRLRLWCGVLLPGSCSYVAWTTSLKSSSDVCPGDAGSGSVRGRQDHDRTRWMLGALLTDGAEQQSEESAPAARADNEQFGAGGRLDQRLRG